MTLVIREAIPNDALSIHQLHTASVRELCSSHYSAEAIDGWLKGRTPEGYRGIAKKEMFVIEKNKEIVGFSHVIPGVIVALFVHPKFSKEGIGTKLMNHAIMKARENWQDPIKLEATLNAQAFYEKFGFQKIKDKEVQRNNIFLHVVLMELA